MSWLFSRALVEEFLEASCSDGKQSVQLKSLPTPQAFCAPDKMTAFSRLSQFGMIFEPLTENRGEELLMWYLEASHAKTSAQQERAPELTASEADFGGKWREWFAKWDRDSYSWKIPQCSLLEGLDQFSETWPRWGTMHDGEYFQLAPLVRHTHVRDCFCWPTPTASDAMPIGPSTKVYQNKNRAWRVQRRSGIYGAKLTDAIGGFMNPMWGEWMMGWILGWTELKPLAMDK